MDEKHLFGSGDSSSEDQETEHVAQDNSFKKDSSDSHASVEHDENSSNQSDALSWRSDSEGENNGDAQCELNELGIDDFKIHIAYWVW